MRYRAIPLSRPRRFVGDVMAMASTIPTVPVERRMQLKAVADARVAAGSPGWPSVFLKAYATVAARTPALRRAFISFPFPHLVEYPYSVASVAVEREYEGELGVFFARLGEPANDSIAHLNELLRGFVSKPILDVKAFRKLIRFAALPTFLRRVLLRLGLNLPRLRPGLFGTFGLSVYSSLGASSLHPISPITTTLTYGVVDRDGSVDVRIVYDHRVLDGAIIARALSMLEKELCGPILDELRSMSQPKSDRVAA